MIKAEPQKLAYPIAFPNCLAILVSLNGYILVPTVLLLSNCAMYCTYVSIGPVLKSHMIYQAITTNSKRQHRCQDLHPRKEKTEKRRRPFIAKIIESQPKARILYKVSSEDWRRGKNIARTQDLVREYSLQQKRDLYQKRDSATARRSRNTVESPHNLSGLVQHHHHPRCPGRWGGEGTNFRPRKRPSRINTISQSHNNTLPSQSSQIAYYKPTIWWRSIKYIKRRTRKDNSYIVEELQILPFPIRINQ